MIKRSPEQWHTLFNEHTQSGLSAAAFCRQRGLCAKHFSKRHKQLLTTVPTSPSQRAFVPVSVIPAANMARIELTLGEAMRLTLPISVSPAWLAQLLQGLRT